MSEACLKAENSIPYVAHFEELCALVRRPVPIVESCSMAAVRASLDLNAAAIFVLSTSGDSARLISKYRPVCPIIMITRNASASRYAHLYRGVYPFFFPEPKPDFSTVNWQEDVDKRIKWGLSNAMQLGILKEGETVVVVQGWKVRYSRSRVCVTGRCTDLRTAGRHGPYQHAAHCQGRRRAPWPPPGLSGLVLAWGAGFMGRSWGLREWLDVSFAIEILGWRNTRE